MQPDTLTLDRLTTEPRVPERLVIERPDRERPRSEVPAPAVSIVITCYNQARFLSEAIESALAQSYRANQIILVDDGSTDETAAVASRYHTVVYISQANRGLPAARNTGLRCSTGEYVVFLDADDRLLKSAIEAGVDCFRRAPHSAFVFGGFRNIFSDGSPAPTEAAKHVEEDHYGNFLQGNFIGMHATVLYSREILEASGGFDERLPACEDYELYLRLSRRWPVDSHAEVIAEYRQHETNMSRDHAFMLSSVLSVLRRERRHPMDSRARAALSSGIRVWKEYYGERLLQDWKAAPSSRNLARVVRMYPGGLLRRVPGALLRRIGRRFRTERTGLNSECTEPVSRQFGFDRGQPIDRYYIEKFLARHAQTIRGRVLEIGDRAYSRRFGGAAVLRQDVLNVAAGNPETTIVADLVHAPQIPSDAFDCIILTQTLHYIFDVRAAIGTLHRILKPGGTVLVTLPGISQICRDQGEFASDCWRFTETSARRLFSRAFGAGIEVCTYGNVGAATAFLQGLAVEDVKKEDLDRHDPDYQLTIAVAAVKESR